MVRQFRLGLVAFAAFVLLAPLAGAQMGARAPFTGQKGPLVEAAHGLVVAQEARAARIGVDVLERGGNAVDAAVATGFALAVTYPRAGNIGGGGFMLIHRAAEHDDIAVDYRETAPAAITRTSFLDRNGNADPAKSRDSALGVGVPGTVAGLALAQARYGSGKFTLAELMAPAIALARAGIPVTDDTADSLPPLTSRLARWPATAKILLKSDGAPLAEGDTLVQTDLAGTLEAIARDGPRAFYEGPTADRIVAALTAAGGVMTREDLKDYRAVERPAVRGTYRGREIVSMPPPSSGGVVLIEMLNILEGYDLGALGAESPGALHLMLSAMQRAYADRAFYLGDPDRVHVPVKGLTAKSYAATLRAEIDPLHARASNTIRPGEPPPPEGENTTHFSVVDRYGNAVANTYTLNFSYGLGMVAEGTGVLLNNELDDFAAKPEAPNFYGLIGFDANAPAGGKRPLSSMAPTIVLENGKPILVTGSPGGSRIPTTVLQVILGTIDFRLDLAAAVAAPRVHHQWEPDVVFAEPQVRPETLAALRALGYAVRLSAAPTSANSIAITPDGLRGAADPRTRGALAAGY